MTTLAPPPDLGASEPLPSAAGGKQVDRMFRAIAFAAGLLVLAILALIAYSTTSKAWPAFAHQGSRFITSRSWNPNLNHFGALDFVYGTMLTAVMRRIRSGGMRASSSHTCADSSSVSNTVTHSRSGSMP